MKLEFDPVADAAYFEISATEVEVSREIESGIIVDYDKNGHVIGIEVLSVSKRSQGIHSTIDSNEARNGIG
jgi:uncharacterized protein YuzE